MTAFPQRDLSNLKNHLSKAKAPCQKLSQEYWQRWSQKYLHLLNNFNKWCKPTRNFKVGDVVLCKDLPEHGFLQWPLAQIVQIHPGEVRHDRVVTLKTCKGTYKRATNKIMYLLEEDAALSSHGGSVVRLEPYMDLQICNCLRINAFRSFLHPQLSIIFVPVVNLNIQSTKVDRLNF